MGQDRGTHLYILQSAKTSQYAWNSVPIDNIDVLQSLTADGREFWFPLDIKLSAIPELNDGSNSTLYNYLRSVSLGAAFSTSVFQVLVEERQEEPRKWWNKGKIQPTPKTGDVVKAHVQIQSNADQGELKKLAYQARGPFQIAKILGNNSYEVNIYNKSDSAVRKYKGKKLYLLPSAVFPHDPLDTTDQQ